MNGLHRGGQFVSSSGRRAALTLCALALCGAPAAGAPAEWSGRGDDLRIVGDSAWAGGGWGGYHPIRLEVTNFGPERDVELRFKTHDGRGLPTTRRRLRLPQNATAKLTLPVPLVGSGAYGHFSVTADGRVVEALDHDLQVAETDTGGPRPSLLAISPTVVDLTPYQKTVTVLAAHWNSSAGWSGGGSRTGFADISAERVTAALLPAAWIDYSGLDFVAVRQDVFASLPEDRRAALLDWAAAGGRLILHGIDGPASESDALAKLLGPAGADRAAWRPARPDNRRIISEREIEQARIAAEHSGMGVTTTAVDEATEVPNEGNPQGTAPESSAWSGETAPFAVRRHGFGRIAAVTPDLFAQEGHADPSAWAWLLAELGGMSVAWPVRYGLDARDGNAEFLAFPVPGVKGVPAISFLLLITLFAVVIGPVNYFWLSRKHQLARLVVTVPVVAAATTVLLFFYSAVQHGVATKGRVRSVTLIDPGSRTATTLARMAVFSGMAPSRGLEFAKTTAAFPLYPPDDSFGAGSADWTDKQALTGDWLPSRTRTQFVTVSRRDERGRLTVTPAGNGFTAANGFETGLAHLIVTGPDGRLWAARDVPAGGEAALQPMTDDDWAAVRDLASELKPEVPDGIDVNRLSRRRGGYRYRYGYYDRGYDPQFASGLLERHLGLLSGPTPQPVAEGGGEPEFVGQHASAEIAAAHDVVNPLAAPRGFLAVAASDPGVDLGGLTVGERESLHVLMGTW